jgi:hypothetical protein
VATAVQQITTELREAKSEKDRIMSVTKIVLSLMKQKGCSKSKHLMQIIFGGSAVSLVNRCKAHIDVALLLETHLKPHERFFIPNYHLYRTDRLSGKKDVTAVEARNDIPCNHADLSPLASIQHRSLYTN